MWSRSAPIARMAASFSSSVKEELTHVEPECSHCEKATLAALVRIEGTLFLSGTGAYRMEIATDSASVARLVIRLLHGIYQLKTDLTVRRSVLWKSPPTAHRWRAWSFGFCTASTS